MSLFIKGEADLLFVHIVAVTFRHAGIQISQEMHEVLPSCSQKFVGIYFTVVANAVYICVTISRFVLKFYFCFVCLILAFFFPEEDFMDAYRAMRSSIGLHEADEVRNTFAYVAWKLTAYIVFFSQGISPSHCREIRLFNNYFDHDLCSKRFCSCFPTKLKHCKPLNVKLCMTS